MYTDNRFLGKGREGVGSGGGRGWGVGVGSNITSFASPSRLSFLFKSCVYGHCLIAVHLNAKIILVMTE